MDAQKPPENASIEFKKCLVIFKDSLIALKGAESFLRNRGWQVYSAINLKECIKLIIKHQPPFALVALDHPNRKARALPKLIEQAFITKVVCYIAEVNSPSLSLLKTANPPYFLMPPLSGPSIERILLKMQKDEKKSGAKKLNDTFSGIEMQKIAKSPEPQNGLPKEIRPNYLKTQTEETNSPIHLLHSLLENENEPIDLIQITASTEELLASKQMGKAHEANQVSLQNENSLSPMLEEMQKGEAGQELSNLQKPHSNPFMDYEEKAQQNPAQFKMNSQTPTGLELKESKGFSAGNDNNLTKEHPFHATMVQPNSKADDQGAFENRTRKKALPQYAYDAPKGKQANLEADSPDAKFQNWQSHSSLIVKGTEEALEKTVHISSNAYTESIKKTENSYCILIESSRFQGYLIAALGDNKRLDESFIQEVQRRLFDFLKKQGEFAQDEESLEIRLKTVEFEAWALSEAEFLRKSIHQGQEVAMAFFPASNPLPLIKSSHKEDMLQIALNDIQTEETLPYDLYIYLPSNQKYVLYTAEGGKLLGQQKERLKAKGIESLHIKKSQLQSTKRFHVEKKLNEKIDRYYKTSKKKPA